MSGEDAAVYSTVLRLLRARLPAYMMQLGRLRRDRAAMAINPVHDSPRQKLTLWDNVSSPLLLLLACEEMFVSGAYLRSDDRELESFSLWRMYSQVAIDLDVLRGLIAKGAQQMAASLGGGDGGDAAPTGSTGGGGSHHHSHSHNHHSSNNKKRRRRSRRTSRAMSSAAFSSSIPGVDDVCEALEQLVFFTQVRVSMAEIYRRLVLDRPWTRPDGYSSVIASASQLKMMVRRLLTCAWVAPLERVAEAELTVLEGALQCCVGFARLDLFPSMMALMTLRAALSIWDSLCSFSPGVSEPTRRAQSAGVFWARSLLRNKFECVPLVFPGAMCSASLSPLEKVVDDFLRKCVTPLRDRDEDGFAVEGCGASQAAFFLVLHGSGDGAARGCGAYVCPEARLAVGNRALDEEGEEEDDHFSGPRPDEESHARDERCRTVSSEMSSVMSSAPSVEDEHREAVSTQDGVFSMRPLHERLRLVSTGAARPSCASMDGVKPIEMEAPEAEVVLPPGSAEDFRPVYLRCSWGVNEVPPPPTSSSSSRQPQSSRDILIALGADPALVSSVEQVPHLPAPRSLPTHLSQHETAEHFIPARQKRLVGGEDPGAQWVPQHWPRILPVLEGRAQRNVRIELDAYGVTPVRFYGTSSAFSEHTLAGAGDGSGLGSSSSGGNLGAPFATTTTTSYYAARINPVLTAVALVGGGRDFCEEPAFDLFDEILPRLRDETARFMPLANS